MLEVSQEMLRLALREELEPALREALRHEMPTLTKLVAQGLRESFRDGSGPAARRDDVLNMPVGQGVAGPRSARSFLTESLGSPQARPELTDASASIVGPLATNKSTVSSPVRVQQPLQGTLTKLLNTLHRDAAPPERLERPHTPAGEAPALPPSPCSHEWMTRNIRGFRARLQASCSSIHEAKTAKTVMSYPAPSGMSDAGSATSKTPKTSQDTKASNPLVRGETSDIGGRMQVGVKSYLSSTRKLFFEGQDNTRSSFSLGSSGHLAFLRKRLAKLVGKPIFDHTMGFLVVLNAVVIGFEVDFIVQHPSEEVPAVLRGFELLFLVLFALEIATRMLAHGGSYFTMPGWSWNVFDIACIGVEVIEEVLQAALAPTDSIRFNVSFARVVHVLRTIKIIRTVRLLRLITEFRMLLVSLRASLRNLAWTVFLMGVLTYVVGMSFTQIVAAQRAKTDTNSKDDSFDELLKYYGSLPSSILCLFQAVTGGIDWRDALEPLITCVSPLLAFVFALYIAFVIFAMMNIVTGVFVESALRCAKDENDIYMINNVREIFLSIKGNLNGTLKLDDFKNGANISAMEDYFREIDVDPSEAKELFMLLDIDDSGAIDAEEFLSGCLRLRGPAKALDLALLRHELKQVLVETFEFRHKLTKTFQALEMLVNIAGEDSPSISGVESPVIGLRKAAVERFVENEGAGSPPQPPHILRGLGLSAKRGSNPNLGSPLPNAVDTSDDEDGETVADSPTDRELQLEILQASFARSRSNTHGKL